ncbi:MAG: DEAD/DEAH box helicase [Myxococcales bacterium]|nr:DEAD/DEAH box helicase [Myxococcales bacterium]
MTFSELGLHPKLLRAVADAGYETPTPIQSASIPSCLEGRDLLGCAQTGTGKTAAFTLPLLQRVYGASGKQPKLRALVLTPTRELAAQIGDSFATYGKHLDLYHTVIFGGVGQAPQEKELKRGVDALVATPGRLLDLMEQGHLHLNDIEIFVLDEADRMLDMGFLPAVKRVVRALPKQRQTLFFSATMPPEIRELAESLLIDPVSVAVTPVSSTAERIEQRLFFVDKANKRNLLTHVLKQPGVGRTLVFSRTKHGANRIAEHLEKSGIRAAAIHGNKSQGARTRALSGFRDASIPVLVATDIAARGIDVTGVTHVINVDLPNVPETYVHRIGRTGRADAAGIAWSFCEAEERPYLIDIERLIQQHIPRDEDHPFPPSQPPPPMTELSRRGNGQSANGSRGPQQKPARPKSRRPGGGSRGPSGHPRPEGSKDRRGGGNRSNKAPQGRARAN